MGVQETLVEPFEWRDAPQADFAVIGDPIAHSKSPAMHNAAYNELGLPFRYVAIRVPVGEVKEALEHLRKLKYRGINITVPHKEEAARAGFDLDDFAREVGVANTIDLATGTAISTDGDGFLEVLLDLDIEPGSRILLLGTGGSGKTLAHALANAGYELTLWNRTHEKAVALANTLEHPVEVSSNPSTDGFSAVVNATSAGLEGANLPVVWSRGMPGQVAIDLLYGKPTKFLTDAVEHGWATEDGKSLLVAQGALAFEYWLGRPAPRDVMRRALD